MNKKKKNNKARVATAKDIHKYLKSCVGEDNLAHVSKKDVAKHFGYKSSNGNGFLSSFKELIDAGLITDVSNNHRAATWVVKDDMKTLQLKTTSATVDDKKVVDNCEDFLTSRGVHVNLLRPIDYLGRKYIPLINITQAFNIDRHTVYNAGSSTNKMVAPYIQMITVDSSGISKKSIEVEGIPFLFERLKKKVDVAVLDVAEKFIMDSFANVDSVSDVTNANSDEVVEATDDNKKSNVISLPNLQEANFATRNIIVSDSIDLPTVSVESNEAPSNEAPSTDVEMDVAEVNMSSNNDTTDGLNEILGTLDGILKVIEEHREFKNALNNLRAENSSLKSENLALNNKIKELEVAVNNSADSEEVKRLKEEIDSLNKKLALANKTTNEVMSRANLIRSYIEDNAVNS